MFAALQRKYPRVQPPVVYRSDADLARRLEREIVPRAARLVTTLQTRKRAAAAP
jgi:hypothetical protein